MKKRIIAIHLPQFHPFPENDEWWGKGFTEWTNVTKAKPRFPGHYQPHLPTETGFYDMRLPEVRQMQAEMAKAYSIDGFCYYHYWFNGKLLMERPVEEILSSGKPDFPFMLCWANENWSRKWDGGKGSVLIHQDYSREDDVDHIRWLCGHVFLDSRYIRVKDKPVFVVYRPFENPKAGEMVATWRSVAREEFGMELYLIGVERIHSEGERILSLGFDATLDFQPLSLNGFERKSPLGYPFMIWDKFLHSKPNPFSILIPYKRYVDYKIKEPDVAYKMFPCVSPGWDNASRRVGKPFTAFYGNTPQSFGKWISNTLKRFKPYGRDEDFVFINAWNEWAEGNHLEPDRKWGTAFLEAVKTAIDNDQNGGDE